MCGIAGKASKSGINYHVDPQRVKILLKERGPDNFGQLILDNIVLFHSRLKILDLSDNANQPMSFNDKHITYNGEIYNYKFLKEKLIKEGYRFKTQSDTEVILKGFDFWGVEVFSKLSGMFGLAILDIASSKLVLARDPLGKKPLYLKLDSQEIVFSSDIRAVKELNSGSLDIDWKTISYYLAELASPQPRTIWKGVCQLEPGTVLEINTKDFSTKSYSYFRKDFAIDYSLKDSEEVELQLESLLANAILRRKNCDVPYGTFLSGGVDSGLITAILAQNSSKQVKTFTVGFDYNPYNEAPKAKQIAQRYNTDHTEIFLEPNITKTIPELISYMGEPFADSSILPTYFICKEIRKDVTVALSGDGGDELFGGYPQYLLAHKSEGYQKKWSGTNWERQAVLFDKILSRVQGGRENLGSYQRYLGLKGSERLYRMMGFSDPEKRLLLSNDLHESISFTNQFLDEKWEETESESLVQKLMLSSMNTRLLNDYLVKIDRASMINSLEIRSPFLDQDLMTFAFSIPRQIIFKNGRSKYLLRKLGTKHLGPGYMDDQKLGFGIPLHRWLNVELKTWKNEILDSIANRENFFNSEYIRKLRNENDEQNAHKIWALICLELWMRENL